MLNEYVMCYNYIYILGFKFLQSLLQLQLILIHYYSYN